MSIDALGHVAGANADDLVVTLGKPSIESGLSRDKLEQYLLAPMVSSEIFRGVHGEGYFVKYKVPIRGERLSRYFFQMSRVRRRRNEWKGRIKISWVNGRGEISDVGTMMIRTCFSYKDGGALGGKGVAQAF